MAIYKILEDKLVELTSTKFSDEKINEVDELQKYIVKSIEIIEKGLLVISTEFADWQDSKRRIDVLCIDKKANLVVIELKRTEDGGHMELQSLRYAAMISPMTFEDAEEAYTKYLSKNGIKKVAKAELLSFLEWEEVKEDSFANDVRIILIAADFSKEVMTTVFWLLNYGLDIKCIRIKPQKDKLNLYIDVQQIIPLPETADYLIKLKGKVINQRQSRNENDSLIDIVIKGETFNGLTKRGAMFLVVSEYLKENSDITALMDLTGKEKWLWVDFVCNTKAEFEKHKKNKFSNGQEKVHDSYDKSRWFNKDKELFQINGKTYVFTNQQKEDTREIIKKIFDNCRELDGQLY
jgi:RecB family endonuclease NucS